MRKQLFKQILTLSLGFGIVATIGCAKDEDRFVTQTTDVAEVAKKEFEQHKISLSVSLDNQTDEELRLIVGQYHNREGKDSREQYPKFRLYNTVADFLGNRRLTQALPANLATYFPGKATYGDVTQQDLDKAPYSVGSTYVGGNLHEASVVVYNTEIGESSVAVTEIKFLAQNIGGKDVLIYKGDVNFNKGVHVLAQPHRDNWHAMAFMGARKQGVPDANTLPESEKNSDVLWRVYLGTALNRPSWSDPNSNIVDDTSGEVTMTNTYHNVALPVFQGLPLASNWTKLDIQDYASATNDPDENNVTDMVLKMQGALLQYDVVVNVSDQLDMRRWGLISNSIDVQGSYYLTAKNVAEAFNTKDGSGFGVPGWKAEAPSYTASSTTPSAFFLYKRSGSDPTRIGDAAYSFPWDLPALHTPYTTAQPKAPGIAAEEVVYADALYAFRRYIPTTPQPAAGSDDYNPDRLLTHDGVYKKQYGTYPGTLLSGTSRSPVADKSNFQRLIFWGMPRANRGANTATFLFADLHNGRFLYQPLTAFSNADAMKQENYAVQKSLVLHQTNGQFREGRISHVQTTVEADLMITEVAHDVRDGKNYTMIELTNLSYNAINIRDYALVRLVPRVEGNMTKYEFYKDATTSTPNIKEAALLPLALAADPYSRSNAYANFTDWENNGNLFVVNRNNSYRKYFNGDVQGAELKPQYILTFGSSDFVDNNVDDHPFVLGAKARITKKAVAYKGTLLDLTENDQPAFALVRMYNNGRGYRIIDATGPLPSTNNYSEGVSEPYPLRNSNSPYLTAWNKIAGGSYSIQRKPGINFPSIFPFRTDLSFTDLWTVNKLELTLGSEETSLASVGYRSNGERRLDGIGASKTKVSGEINRNTVPADAAPSYNYWSLTPAHDYNWWASRYRVNIPTAMQY